MKKPLTRVEKDRMLVMFLSFLIIIVFWGAFEQAGGLMSLYTEQKTDRMLFGWLIPTPMFQGLNAGFILLLATAVHTLQKVFTTARRLENLPISWLQ